jgi:hypothetical protein
VAVVRSISNRPVPRTLAAVLALALAAPCAGGPDEPTLAEGIRKVEEGDYEGAVPALEAVRRRLEAQGAPAGERARACLYLGIAHVALDQRDAAKSRFREAIGYDEGLRLTPEHFSPKVIAVFEEARSESRTAAASTKKARSKTPLVLLGVGAAAAAGVAIAAGRDGAGSGGPPSFSGARFTTPVLVCPDGARDQPLLVGIQVGGSNPTNSSLAIRAVTAVLIIVDSPAVPAEVGFASTAAASVTPSSLAAGADGSLLVETTLLCGNGEGDPSRYNEWTARLTLDTSAGVFAAETADRMRVNIP